MRLGVLASLDSWYLHDLKRAAALEPDCQELVGLTFSSLQAALGPHPVVSTREYCDLSRLDALLVRSMPPGSLEQVVFRMNALHRLSAHGTPVLNSPRSLEVAIDKYLALAQLQAAGLNVPPTRVAQSRDQAMVDFHELGRDVVIKPVFGGEGRGMMRVTDEAHAWRIFQSLTLLNQLIYQQQFLPHQGADLRVLLVGDRAFGMRRANAHDWRTNVSCGATTETITVDDQLRDTAQRAAAATGTEIAGVDILPTCSGDAFVLEVNAVPGWRALAKTLDVDIARVIIRYLMQQADNG